MGVYIPIYLYVLCCVRVCYIFDYIHNICIVLPIIYYDSVAAAAAARAR